MAEGYHVDRPFPLAAAKKDFQFSVIESADDGDVWGTVGASENIIEASWLALVDAVEYKLYKDERAVRANVGDLAEPTSRGRAKAAT